MDATRSGLGPCLPGDPRLPFHVRCNKLWARQSNGTFMVLAVANLIAYRCWPLLSPAALSWLMTAYALCALDLLWRRLWPAAYERHREVLAAALCLNCFRAGAPWLLMRRFLDDLGPSPAGAGMAAHAARLLFASGAPKMAVHLLAVRMRLGVSAAVQLAVVLASLAHNQSICAAAPLASPSKQRMTRQLYLLVSTAARVTRLAPAEGGSLQPSPSEQCVLLLTWLRVAIALLAPLAWQALSEAALFRWHQAERQRAGLPLERGVHAVVYSATAALSQGGGAVHAAIVGCLLLALSWACCTLVLLPAPG